MIYLDTSALAKLLVAEPETPELRSWLVDRSENDQYMVTSALSRIELLRAVVRQGEPGLADRARFLLDGMDILPITDAVVTVAESIGPAGLRSLDAIHLASAARIGSTLTCVVTYDRRLAEGCRAVGITSEAPGAQT